MRRKETLLGKIEAYTNTEAYPFHMPGHKRQVDLGITHFPNPFSVDITEIDGFDDLHCPDGILKESMKHAAAVYGSDRTYYLVNGSTCGILSALCGVTKKNGSILMARNSHKAAYHAVLLNTLNPVYIYPDYIEEYGIQGAIAPEVIEAALKENRELQAVYITSPTYEGIVSDVESIATIVHRYGIPLIVDEAHGAHFSFGGGPGGMFPASALLHGADVVIQSLHKTLPSLTQTAVLHIKSKFVKPEQIEQYLQIFQSSSPSYLFLAAIENCIGFMEAEGTYRLEAFARYMAGWMKECKSLENIGILSDSIVGNHHVKGRDLSKLVVFTKRQIGGNELAKLLREKYHMEPEMSCHSYVLLMTSLMDTTEGLEKLKKALFEIDRELEGSKGSKKINRMLTWLLKTESCMSIAKAAGTPLELIDLSLAAGRISGDFITVYPPGIPALVPGERVTEEAVAMIIHHLEAGLRVEGVIADGSSDCKCYDKLKIRVVIECRK